MLERISDTYDIIGKIGAGKGGTIYKAYHKRLQKEVVLKKINSSILGFRDSRIEADILKNLRHSCIPQVLDFLEIDGDVYTVMDFIPGHSFQEYLDKGRTFSQKQVAEWAVQICSTLSYLHSRKPPIVHSDIKPANIMLTPEGNICLIDFNVSAVLNGQGTRVYGYSPGYAAPELIAAAKHNRSVNEKSQYRTVDARADIYSLGATLYHLMTGRIPARRPGDIRDIREYRAPRGEAQGPGERRGQDNVSGTSVTISEVFAGIIMKCLEARPDRRFQSASELLLAIQGMGRQDKRYQRLVFRQRVIYGGLGAAFLLCGGLTVRGNIQMEQDKARQYEGYIKEASHSIEEADFENFETFYQKALKVFPHQIDAYYQKAVALNAQGEYEENILYITGTILTDSRLLEQDEMLGNVYYLLGNAYEHTEKYPDAARSYEKALRADSRNSDYYRDYAIALAKEGDLDAAGKALDEAEENGADSGDLIYVKGEIAFQKEDYTAAKEYFVQCLEAASDDYTRMRAGVMACRAIDSAGKNEEGCREKIALLEETKASLPAGEQVAVLEGLAQAYMDMAEYSQDNTYLEKAADTLLSIRDNGWGTYTTDENLAALYRQQKEFDLAEEELERMLETYGEDYRIYKNLAFLEADRQGEKEKSQRSYQKFGQYYEKAEELYRKQLDNNETDPQMKRLEELHQQAVKGGWIT